MLWTSDLLHRFQELRLANLEISARIPVCSHQHEMPCSDHAQIHLHFCNAKNPREFQNYELKHHTISHKAKVLQKAQRFMVSAAPQLGFRLNQVFYLYSAFKREIQAN